MVIKITILSLLLTVFALEVHGQTSNSNEKRWSAIDRISISDFGMDIESSKHHPCFAQFSINYSVNGFDFMTKNFNQKVECGMLRSASWINADAPDQSRLIYFQQVLFDISELYSRKFRKLLLENRMKIAQGTQIARELNEQVMKEFSEERAKFERESEGGLDEKVMESWLKRISNEIAELDLYDYDNTKKIKIDKK